MNSEGYTGRSAGKIRLAMSVALKDRLHLFLMKAQLEDTLGETGILKVSN